jgi:peptidyl-prolyl cis-trans isomerase B (cyclophilin B)
VAKTATIETSRGTIVAELFDTEVPGTVANFEKLANSEFYDGTRFHRVIDDFMIQGGDPLSKDPALADSYGTGDPGYKIKAEFNDHKHVRGVLSMARSSDPDSAGSQFFIMLGDAPFLDHKYTAFGQLIKGDDVLSKIAKTPTTMGPGGEPSKPTERVEIKSIEIMPRSSVK